MTDKKEKTEAEKLFEAVASGTAAPAPAPVVAQPGAPAVPTPVVDPAKALFADVAKAQATAANVAPPPDTVVEPGSAAEGRLVAERSGDPRFAPGKNVVQGIQPTPLQEAASPIVRGLSAMADIPNILAGGLLRIPSPRSLLGLESDESKKQSRDLSDYYLKNTGDEGLINRKAREHGIIPPDPAWRPEGWLARSLYDTTNLATQIGTGGALSRIAAPFKAALSTRAHTLDLPLQPPRTAMAAPSSATVPVDVARELSGLGARELVASGVGGVAGATAHANAPGPYKDVAESTAEALGAMTPYALPRLLGGHLERLYNMFGKPQAADTGQRLAGMVGHTPAELQQEYQRGRELAPTIEGWAPSPGSVIAGSTAPGERNAGTSLLGIERREADKPTLIGDPLNQGQTISPAELRQRNAQALQTELRVLGPDGNPMVPTAEMQARIERARELAARRAGTLQTEAGDIDRAAGEAQAVVNAQLPPIAPGERTQARADASRRMFSALDEAHERAAIQGGNLFDAVDPEKTATVPMYRLRDALDEVKALAVERGRTDAVPKVMIKPKDTEGAILGDKVDDFLHNWETQPANPKFLANVPYERVKGLRSRLTTAQREATDPQEREFLGRLIGGVDAAVAESGTGALAQRYSVARDFWRDNVARPFREGPVATILKKDKDLTGAGTLMAPGERGGQNMQQIAASARQDPDLYQSVVNYARADMTAFTTNVDGRVNGAKLKEWVDKHAPVLNHFPELQQEFGRLTNAQRAADAYLTQASERSPALRALADRGIKNTEDTIKRSAARFYLNAEPEDVINRILAVKGAAAKRQAAEAAMGMLKTREAREGLQRAYYDTVVKRSLGSEERVDPKGGWKNTFTNILDKEAPVAEVLLPSQVRDRMKRLEKASSMETARDNARANVGARTAEDTGSTNPADMSVGHRLVQSLRGDLPTTLGGATAGGLAGSALGPLGSGAGAVVGGSGAYMARHLMLARTAAKEAALREALFNGDVFEKVMSSATLDPIVRKRIGEAIKPYVLIANTEAAGDHARP